MRFTNHMAHSGRRVLWIMATLAVIGAVKVSDRAVGEGSQDVEFPTDALHTSRGADGKWNKPVVIELEMKQTSFSWNTLTSVPVDDKLYVIGFQPELGSARTGYVT